jgi:hypothetical protein
MPTPREMLESFGRNESWMMWFFGMPIDPRRSTSAASHDRGAVSAAQPVTRAPFWPVTRAPFWSRSRRRSGLPDEFTV